MSDPEWYGDQAQSPTERLLEAYWRQACTAERFAALRLMRAMSDVREALWGVVQAAVSDLDFDFTAYAAEHLRRLQETTADPRFEDTRSRIARMIAAALSEQAVRYVVALSSAGVGREGIAGPPAGLLEYEQRLFELSDALFQHRAGRVADPAVAEALDLEIE